MNNVMRHALAQISIFIVSLFLALAVGAAFPLPQISSVALVLLVFPVIWPVAVLWLYHQRDAKVAILQGTTIFVVSLTVAVLQFLGAI